MILELFSFLLGLYLGGVTCTISVAAWAKRSGYDVPDDPVNIIISALAWPMSMFTTAE
jgi:hypothetical protein